MQTGRKGWGGVLLGAVLLAAVAPVPTRAQEQERKEKMTVVYASTAINHAVTWITKEAGYFDKYGLEVDLLFAGGGRAVTALLSGNAPIVTVGGPTAIAARLGGGETVILANVFNKMLFSLMTDPAIKTVDDLRGKTIGVSRIGAATHFALLFALKHLKLEVGKDVTIIQTGGEGETLAVLKGRAVAGGVMAPPLTTNARDLGFVEFFNMATMDIEYPQTAIVTTRGYLTQKPEVVKRFLMAYAEGIQHFRKHRAFAITTIAKYTKIDDLGSVGSSYDEVAPFVQQPPYPTATSVQMILDEQAEKNPSAKTARATDFFDASILKALEAEGFFKKLLGS